MAEFIDAMGRKWLVELDAPLLGKIRDVAKVDFTNVDGEGFFKVETDEVSLVRVLEVICQPQIEASKITDFAKQIRKDAIPAALTALEVAAADFFPTKRWSDIQSRLDATRAWEPFRKMLADPSIPKETKDAMISEMTKRVAPEDISSTNSAVSKSVTGPDAIPSSATTDSVASAG